MLIDKINLSDIYEFMETGNPENAPEGIVQYLELLSKIYAMTLRIDKFSSKEMVIKHLVMVEKIDGKPISRFKASQLHSEVMEYFYNDLEVSKKAHRNYYASIMDQEINFARLTQKDGADAKRIVEMAEKAANMRGVFDEEIEELPEELFRTPFIVYTCDAELLGLPKVDRNKLSAQIDAYPDITEKEKMQIKSEAQIIPIKIFRNEQEDARKS